MEGIGGSVLDFVLIGGKFKVAGFIPSDLKHGGQLVGVLDE